MSTVELNKAIEKVAKATSKTKSEVAAKLKAKDHWTWFLINNA